MKQNLIIARTMDERPYHIGVLDGTTETVLLHRNSFLNKADFETATPGDKFEGELFKGAKGLSAFNIARIN